MSIVVAVRKNNSIVMASDTQNNFGAQIVPIDNHRTVKIRRIGDVLLGSTGWGLYENILEDYLQSGQRWELNDQQQIFRFFLKFWQTMRKEYTFVNDQCEDKDDSPFADLDASFIVANSNGIFYVGSDISVTPFQKFYAIGSGYQYSLGALQTLYADVDSAGDLARSGVEAAMAFDLYCGGEVDLYTIEGTT